MNCKKKNNSKNINLEEKLEKNFKEKITDLMYFYTYNQEGISATYKSEVI